MFEEQKIAMDQRYRQLLEDAIQDAVFLSSRNNELQDETKGLRQREYGILFNAVLQVCVSSSLRDILNVNLKGKRRRSADIKYFTAHRF